MSAHDADVIVVGCGPVGVMAALRCAQRGLRVIAVDRSNEIYPLPRAVGMDDEIQELFERAGLIDQLRTYSSPLRGGEFVNADGEQVVGIELPEGTVGPLGLPPIVTFDQPAVEQFLRTAALDAGVDMRLGLDVFAAENVGDNESGEGVRIDLTGDTGDVSLTARWLIAADGAKSTVRSLRGISMTDQGFDQTWLVIDTKLLDPNLELPVLARQYCDPARICTFVPGHGAHRRWEFQLRPDELREEVLDESVINNFLSPWGTPHQLQVSRAAVYRFHAAVAETFRDGPVFLAGDAAHQMPPFNGQGMCTGMRDAENLTWKLAQVARGEACDVLLDTYDEERRPHAAGQVEHSVDAGQLMLAIAHEGAAALDSGYGQRPFPKLEGSRFEAGHDLVGAVLPQPLEGLLDLGVGWTILQLDADEIAPEPHGVTIVRVPRGAYPGILDVGLSIVVRPDRYVAAITDDLARTSGVLFDPQPVATSSAT